MVVGGGVGEQALVHSSHLPLLLGHPQESRHGGGEARFSLIQALQAVPFPAVVVWKLPHTRSCQFEVNALRLVTSLPLCFSFFLANGNNNNHHFRGEHIVQLIGHNHLIKQKACG